MRKEIAERAERAIVEKVFPGCVIGVVRKNGEREILPFGNFTYESDSPKVREDTVYDVASITKSIPTASLALTLIAEGKLRSTDAVVKYLPELKNDYGATIEDLLTYRVRGPQLSTLKDKTPDEILKYVFAHGFDAPHREPEYTNLPAFLLGLIIERVSVGALDTLAQKTFFAPLKMSHTTFFPQKREECAPTEIDDAGTVQGIVHDESARVFARAKRTVGHAGLFSTAGDLLNFLEALLRGELKTVADGAQRGLGWQASGDFLGREVHGRFGKTGFTGTSCVCDIECGIAFAILSNRTYPKRSENDGAVNSFRADIADVLFESAV